MTSAIIALGVGYFVTYHVPNILSVKGKLNTIIKIIGIIFLIMGFVALVESVSDFISSIADRK